MGLIAGLRVNLRVFFLKLLHRTETTIRLYFQVFCLHNGLSQPCFNGSVRSVDKKVARSWRCHLPLFSSAYSLSF